MAKTVELMVSEAKRRIRNATPEEVADDVLAGGLVVVDVREPDEFEQGHIPGAVNIPRGWLEFRADPTCPAYDQRIAPDGRLLVTCAIGGRSALAAAALQELDYANVTNLEFGFEGWRKAGYPIRQPAGAPVA
ncbi:MAG TPA: rhodanese-like domain-containing protein [Gaiellaceae bacterium]|nr:rhodanese-like domain-containing protein [Gaiellaceae bacterium]